MSKHAGGPEMGKPGSTSWGGAVVLFAVTVLGYPSLACDDPYALEGFEVPDTALLYSMAQPELNLASAFDFLGGMGMAVESAAATGDWDMEPLVLDPEKETLTFRYLLNPNCNSLRLVP